MSYYFKKSLPRPLPKHGSFNMIVHLCRASSSLLNYEQNKLDIYQIKRGERALQGGIDGGTEMRCVAGQRGSDGSVQ